MKVLIAGADGFVGRYVVSYVLENTDWDVVALDRYVVERGDDPRVRAVCYDLHAPIDPDAAALRDVDAVINLAASSDVFAFLEDPHWHTLNTVTSALTLLEWARHRKLKAFIQLSTNEVYGPQRAYGGLNVEWDPLLPQTPYSASKAAQEMLAIGWQRTYGVPTIIVNTAHVFGEGQPKTRFVPAAIGKILDERPVSIYHRRGPDYNADAPMYGAQERNWTYVGDLAHALVWLLSVDEVRGRADRWNVAGPVESCLSVARMLGVLLKRTFTIEWIDGDHRPGYDFRYALDCTKIYDEGFKERFGLAAGLQRTITWMLEERSKDLEA